MEPITDKAGFDRVTALPAALLLKHGARCPISANARTELASFAKSNPSVPVYSLDVSEHGDLSRDVAHALGVRHESPQLLMLRGGRPAWHTEHYEINADDIG